MHPSISPIDHLDVECEAMTMLLDVIKQEQKHLIEANIEDIAKVTEQKTKIIGKIAELAEGRHHALGLVGYLANDASMQVWLETARDTVATGKWSMILELAKTAKEMNLTNGLLINQHLTRNRNALNVLQGTNESGNFYGPNGQSTKKHAPRRLVIG